MRTVRHLGVIASLLFAFTRAPFQHTHDHDAAHRHAHGFSHTHLATGPSAHDDHHGVDHGHDRLALEAADPGADVRLIDWLGGDGQAPLKLLFDLPATVESRCSLVQTAIVEQPAPRNHGPPRQSSLHPRAPPA